MFSSTCAPFLMIFHLPVIVFVVVCLCVCLSAVVAALVANKDIYYSKVTTITSRTLYVHLSVMTCD